MARVCGQDRGWAACRARYGNSHPPPRGDDIFDLDRDEEGKLPICCHFLPNGWLVRRSCPFAPASSLKRCPAVSDFNAAVCDDEPHSSAVRATSAGPAPGLPRTDLSAVISAWTLRAWNGGRLGPVMVAGLKALPTMNHKRGRALRRHHLRRHKLRAKLLAHLWQCAPTPRFCGIHARTRPICSCPGCGNPRRHRLSQKEQLTLQEKRALLPDE